MRVKHKAILENAIDKALVKICNDGDHDGYVYDDLVEDMAISASIVFDSCMKGQEFDRCQEQD
jgi:hypothetical protein